MDLKGRMLHLVQSDGKDTKYSVTEKEPLNLPAPLVSIVTGAFWTMHFLYSSQNGTLLVCRERWSEPRDAPHAEVPRAGKCRSQPQSREPAGRVLSAPNPNPHLETFEPRRMQTLVVSSLDSQPSRGERCPNQGSNRSNQSAVLYFVYLLQ